jgi:hypothetical protein
MSQTVLFYIQLGTPFKVSNLFARNMCFAITNLDKYPCVLTSCTSSKDSLASSIYVHVEIHHKNTSNMELTWPF